MGVVRYEVVRRVARLTIDRPQARNALSAEVRRAMAQPHVAAAYAAPEALWEPVHLSADAQEGPAALRDTGLPVWTGG